MLAPPGRPQLFTESLELDTESGNFGLEFRNAIGVGFCHIFTLGRTKKKTRPVHGARGVL